ncbi:hypothetical protein LIS82_06725 [Cytobacillus solani]|uniref:hypothetical protein n=1 Tax=Cytobacillus solani TaxID=1637975 RepID=UPI00207AFCF0|nr:hypothetical protein [Cytobacillus solani]USK56176.1 hypothetical protein LIS82_06725 [Cytobacillus solani]
MNIMKLNIRQSIFVLLFVFVLAPSLGYFTALYLNTTLFIPIIAVGSALAGGLVAKKMIRTKQSRIILQINVYNQ